MEKTESITEADRMLMTENEVIERFTKKTLHLFALRRTADAGDADAGDTIRNIERIDGRDCEIRWRFFINHFFFVERGKWLKGAVQPEYMSLVRRQRSSRDDRDNELLAADINSPENWVVKSVDTETWGENWNEAVGASETEVIGSMIAFLFERGYIVADLEDDDEDDEVEKAPAKKLRDAPGTPDSITEFDEIG